MKRTLEEYIVVACRLLEIRRSDVDPRMLAFLTRLHKATNGELTDIELAVAVIGFDERRLDG